MDPVGRDVDGLARFQGEVVHGEEGDKDARVGVGVLVREAWRELGDVLGLLEVGKVRLGQGDEGLVGVPGFFGRHAENLVHEGAQVVVVEEAPVGGARHEEVLLQLRRGSDEVANDVQGLEADKGLKVGEGQGDLGLVVGIGEGAGVLLVLLGGVLLVRVDLQREGLGDGQDLGEEGELGVAEALDDVVAQEGRGVAVNDVLERLVGGGDVRRESGIGAHPHLGVGLVVADLEGRLGGALVRDVAGRLGAELRGERAGALLAPWVRVAPALELVKGLEWCGHGSGSIYRMFLDGVYVLGDAVFTKRLARQNVRNKFWKGTLPSVYKFCRPRKK